MAISPSSQLPEQIEPPLATIAIKSEFVKLDFQPIVVGMSRKVRQICQQHDHVVMEA
jgi:hypothetical protein